MTNIHFPTDGKGAEALKKQNKANSTAFHIDAVAPDAKNQNKAANKEEKESSFENSGDESTSAIENDLSTRPTPTDKTLRDKDRRNESRRTENTHVLLNTRSKQDRRKSAGQRADDTTQDNSSFGIDTKA